MWEEKDTLKLHIRLVNILCKPWFSRKVSTLRNIITLFEDVKQFVGELLKYIKIFVIRISGEKIVSCSRFRKIGHKCSHSQYITWGTKDVNLEVKSNLLKEKLPHLSQVVN